LTLFPTHSFSLPVKAKAKITKGMRMSKAKVMATKMLEVLQLMRNIVLCFWFAQKVVLLFPLFGDLTHFLK